MRGSRGASVRLVLGAISLFACARQDQSSVQAPLAEIGSIKIVEPASISVEPTSQSEAEENTKGTDLEQFERWARGNIRFAFSSRPFRSDTCFNGSDLEVACSNPKAARQETSVWDEVTSTVINRSDATVTCETSGRTKEGAALPPKGTLSFSIRTISRAADAEREPIEVRCTMLAEDAITIGALPSNTGDRIEVVKRRVGLEVRFGTTDTTKTLLSMGTSDPTTEARP